MDKNNTEDKSISAGKNIEGSNLVTGNNNLIENNTNIYNINNYLQEDKTKDESKNRLLIISTITVIVVLSLSLAAFLFIRDSVFSTSSAEENTPTTVVQNLSSNTEPSNIAESPTSIEMNTGQESASPANAIQLFLEETVNQSISVPGDNRIFVYEATKPEVIRIELVEKDKGGYFHPEGTILFNGESLSKPLDNITPNIVSLPSAGTYTIVIKAGKKAKFEETGEFAITVYSLDASNPKAKFLQSGQSPISGTLKQYGSLEVYFYNATEDNESISISRSTSSELKLEVVIYNVEGDSVVVMGYKETAKLDKAGTYAIVVAPWVTAGSVDYGDFTIKLDKLP